MFVSTKQASRLKGFKGGRSPSTDTKIRAQQRRGERVERGRRKERRRPVESGKGWPAWPALSLEHVAADEAMIKGGEKGTPRERPGPRRWLLTSPCVCIYAQVSNIGQNSLVKE